MNKRIAIMKLCGTYAPIQFECDAMGLVPMPRDEYERLLEAAAELAAIKAGNLEARAA
ncbi:MAG TPA: hypothetical protein VMT67_11675 [Terriglobales bacterium]|nr:hypothetical protein [Terriglobales bacterium]